MVQSKFNNHILGDGEEVNEIITLKQAEQFIKDKTHITHINNINNIYLYNKLDSIFSFSSIAKIKPKRVKNKINDLIIKLRISGYFSRIHFSYNTSGQTVIFSLHLKLNPVLSKIQFLDIRQLMIPAQELQDYSSYLVGYPKSLTQLHLITEKIKNWYSAKGYEWIAVHTLELNPNNPEVHLFIREGIIDKIYYILFPLINQNIPEETSTKSYIPSELVTEIIQDYIPKQQMPNRFDIEKAMYALRNSNFFYNFYYDIKFSENVGKVEISIHFVPYRDTVNHLETDKIIKKVSPYSKLEKLLQGFYENTSKHGLKHFWNQFGTITTHNKLISENKLSLKYIYGIKEKLTTIYTFFNVDVQNASPKLNFAVDENFNLHEYHSKIYFMHSNRYLGSRYDFLDFIFKQENRDSEYDLSYNAPLVLYKKGFSPLSIRIFHNKNNINFYNKENSLSNFAYKKNFFLNSYELNRKGIDFYFKRHLLPNGKIISIILANRHIYYENFNFNRNQLFFTQLKLKSLNYVLYSKNKIFKNCIPKQEIRQLIHQNFQIWNLRWQFPYMDNWYHPTKGIFIQVDYLQFYPLNEIIKKMKNIKKMNQLFVLKLIHYLRSLPKYPYSPYHLIISKIFVAKLTGPQLIYSIPDILRSYKYKIDKHHPPDWISKSNFSEYLIEYHFRVSKYTNPVFSLKVFQYSPLLEEYPVPHVQGELFYSNRLNLLNLSTGKYIGLGWEIRTMISQIPPIRVEIIKKLPGKSKIYLRVIPYLY
uniref:hypothetical protein n=1 Tax=Rhodaphanes brevistipitata TaxID=446136 RepID=UPI001FCCF63F|nr:hypothetical protein MW432_pgp035 [Rhodaphanes brevistipitata]UNJ18546.1 hypothetical protein [Rhodaphanes brevistipitata]